MSAGLAASCGDDGDDDGSDTGGGRAGAGAAGRAGGGSGGTGGAGAFGGGGGRSGAGTGGVPIGGSSGRGGTSGGAGTSGASGATPGGMSGGGAGGDTGDAGEGPGGSGGTSGEGGSDNGPTAGVGGSGEGGAGGQPGNVSTCEFPASAALAKASVPDGFCAWTWASGVDDARGIATDAAGNVLVVARGSSSIIALWDADGDGASSGSERATLVTQSGLNHGIALHGGYLYASSATAVYRWPYSANRAPLTGAQTVINGIPSGGHTTRTLAFDDDSLYVSVGSAGNVDANSNRARIRRFEVDELGATPIAFGEGEVFADGLRNEVGLRFDSSGRLWGVENGRDNLRRDDLGGDIHDDNPAEELNLFLEPGAFYGYPYCWSEFLLPEGVGMGPGTQWADPDNDAETDEWCRDPNNVVPPVLSMQAHSAPLDLLFYPGGSFPAAYTGDLFVSFHGSWNRDEPTGYKVMRVPFGDDGMPSGDPVSFLEYSGQGDIDDDWPHRPVSLTTLPNGVLLITSDASDRVLAVGYSP